MKMYRAKSISALTIVTAALMILVCGYSLCYNIIAVTMTPIINTFALTGTSQGLMTSMQNLGSILPLFIIPMLQGRVRKIWLILSASLLEIAMMFLTGAAADFPMLLTACVLLGAGNNFLDTTVNAYIVDLHPNDSSKYLGMLHGFFGIGGLLTPILISAILAHGTWRASYYISGAIFAGIVALFAIVAVPRRRKLASETAAAEQKLTAAMLKRYISGKRNLCLLAAGAFYAAAQLGLVNWVAYYETVRFNAVNLGSACVSAYWICCAVCRLFSGRLPFKPEKMLIAGAALGGVFHAAGILSGDAVVMVIASGLVGLVSGLCIPVLLSEAAWGNSDMTSLTTSGIFLIMGVARMLMPLGMGAVAAGSIVAAMLLPALASVISAVLCAFAYFMKK